MSRYFESHTSSHSQTLVRTVRRGNDSHFYSVIGMLSETLFMNYCVCIADYNADFFSVV